MNDTDVGAWVCPTCRGPVARGGDALSCGRCAAEYAMRGSVIDFMPKGFVLEDHDHDHDDEDHHHDPRPSGSDASEAFETTYVPKRPRLGPLTEAVADRVFRAERIFFEDQRARLGRALDILDIGAGSLVAGSGPDTGGRHYRNLRAHARSYVGLEPSWAMIDDVLGRPDPAISYLPAGKMVRGVGEYMPFPDASFDVAVTLSALDHASSAERVLSEARRVLRKGGAFFISLQNYEAWQRAVLDKVAPGYMQRHREQDHHTPIVPNALEEQLRAVGFTDVSVESIGYFNAMTSKVAWLERTLWWLPAKVLGEERMREAVARADAALDAKVPRRGSVYVTIAR